MLTNGTASSVSSDAPVDPGDAIALEDPGYLSARRIFLSQGAKLFSRGRSQLSRGSLTIQPKVSNSST